jgi:mannosyl-oligosaccharide alpha-1,2-mannosidase
VSLGGLGDSYYEYLLKRFILGGKTEKEFREFYDESMEVCEKRERSGVEQIEEY